MTEMRDHWHRYESPQIESWTAIDDPLIGGAVSSNTDTSDSASFRSI